MEQEYPPLFPEEGKLIVCGIDEAGRGPLAGPVTAAAVILPPDFPTSILNDSKKLTKRRRQEAEAVIRERASWAVGWASVEEIDRYNILRATFLAMRRAFDKLREEREDIDIALVDGNGDPGLGIPTKTIVKGDAKIPSIQAASILAKEARDRYMVEVADAAWPQYGFAIHKGYPTALHRKKLRLHGMCPLHRRSFHERKREEESSLF